MKKKVCKNCKIFIDGAECPVCHSNQFSTNWQGRINFLNVEKSMIAGKMNAEKNGEYAIKVR